YKPASLSASGGEKAGVRGFTTAAVETAPACAGIPTGGRLVVTPSGAGVAPEPVRELGSGFVAAGCGEAGAGSLPGWFRLDHQNKAIASSRNIVTLNLTAFPGSQNFHSRNLTFSPTKAYYPARFVTGAQFRFTFHVLRFITQSPVANH